ncbi:MAG: tetratricopeptide repeat protein [Chthoniobacterales bacterium]|jgi:TolA-binding protein
MDKNRPRSILLPAVSTDPETYGGDFFWEEHWQKFVIALVAVVLGILAVGGWSFVRASQSSASAALYASAANLEQWQEVVATYPGSLVAGNAQMHIATSLLGEGKLDEAAGVLDQFTALQPEHPLAGAAWLTLGEIRQLQKNSPAALEAYRVASSRYQQSYAAPLALLAEARLLDAEGKSGESRAILESIATSYPDGPAAMVAAAQAGTGAAKSDPSP